MDAHRLFESEIAHQIALAVMAQVERDEREHLDRMVSGSIGVGGRGAGNLANTDSGSKVVGRGSKCGDHARDPFERNRLKPGQLEQRGAEPEREARIAGVLAQVTARPASRHFRPPENARHALRQRRGRSGKAGRQQGKTAERRAAHEFRTGDKHDDAAREVVLDRLAGDPRLAGIDDEHDLAAEPGAQFIDVSKIGQHQAGLGAVDHVDQRKAARRQRRFDRCCKLAGKLAAFMRLAAFAAHRRIGHGHRRKPCYRLAR